MATGFRYSVILLFLLGFILITHEVNLMANGDAKPETETLPKGPESSEIPQSPSPSPGEIVTMMGRLSIIIADPTREDGRIDPSRNAYFVYSFLQFPQTDPPKFWGLTGVEDLDLKALGGAFTLRDDSHLLKITGEVLNGQRIHVLSIEITSIPVPEQGTPESK